MPKKIDPKAVEKMQAYLNSLDWENDGFGGICWETEGRAFVTGVFERLHPAGVADAIVKSGVVLEFKSGAGELSFGVRYETKAEAEAAKANGEFLQHCTHIAYVPKVTSKSLSKPCVCSKRRFVKMLQENNLLRVKENGGFWKVTIQNYLPTANFKPSAERVNRIFEFLETCETLEQFASRMFKEDFEN